MQIVGLFASDAFVCAFRLQHGAVIPETQQTKTFVLLAGNQDTESAHFWYAKPVVTDLWHPRKFSDVTLLCATATHYFAVSAGLELRSTHSRRTGPATLELKAKCKWTVLSTAALWHGAGGCWKQNPEHLIPGSAPEPRDPASHYLFIKTPRSPA